MEILIQDAVTALTLKDSRTGLAPAQNTTVELWTDRGYINILFKVSDLCPFSYGEKDNDPLYQGDVVEAFISLDGKKYLEIEVNPDGKRFYAVVTNPDGEGGSNKLDFLSECPFVSRVTATGYGYDVNIAIEIAELAKLGFDEKGAEINLYRQDRAENGYIRLYALSPTLCATFHRRSSFVPLRFVD